MTAETIEARTPEQNAEDKAEIIAPFAWAHGLTSASLPHLPHAGTGRRDPTPTLSSLARAAYAKAGVVRGVPSRTNWHLWLTDGPGTWCLVRRMLHAFEAWVAANPEQAAAREARSPRDRDSVWASAARPQMVRSGLAEIERLPTGWADLAEKVPDQAGTRCIHHRTREGIVNTPDGWRCWQCPPVLDEFPPSQTRHGTYQPQHGWGCWRPSPPGRPAWRVNWAPNR